MTQVLTTPDHPPARRHFQSRVALLFAFFALFAGFGCARVPVYEQMIVSKPNMVFSDYGAFTYQAKLVAQTEPGAAVSGGAQAAGCTSCR